MLRKAATMVVLVGALSSCGVLQGDGEGDKTAAPLTTPTAEHEVRLPLESYYPTPEQDALLDRARGQLILECMRSFGLSFNPGVPATSQSDPYRTNRFLLSDAGHASKYGYHSEPNVYARQERAEESAEKNAWEPTPVEKMVFSGSGANEYKGKRIPPGGCRQKAFGALSTLPAEGTVKVAPSLGPVAPDIYFVQSLRHQANRQTEQDSRVLTMEGLWSSCMQKAGYQYRSTGQAANDPRWQVGTFPQRGEIEVATADVRCKKEANYLGVMQQVTTEYQNELVENHAEALSQFKKDYDEQLRRATDLLSGESAG